MKINELVTTAHGAARAKGWWDGVIRTEEEASMLVVTEVAEASEAVRNKLPAICQMSSDGKDMWEPNDQKNMWIDNLKPEGEATELADVVIRIADFFGWKDWDLGAAIQDGLAWGDLASSMAITELAQRCFAQHAWIGGKQPLEAHLYIANWATKVTETHDAYIALGQCAALTLSYCGAKGLPIEQAIELKLKYNECREYRHGNKLL